MRGYIYLLCVAMMFSFGGTCAKNITPYFSARFCTLFRFTGGVFFLLALKFILGRRFDKKSLSSLIPCLPWIFFGAAAKWGAYILENSALSRSASYGNIITQPAQTVFITLVSIMVFHERLTIKKAIYAILCMLGVLVISLNGRSVAGFFSDGLSITVLFVLSGFCAGGHVLSQKMITGHTDIIDGNLAIFALAAVFSIITVMPGIRAGELAVHVPISCIIAILAFGFITGIGFYLNASAIPLVPLFMVPLLQSTMVLFALLWGILFFHETITVHILAGTAIFMFGLIRLQMLNSRKG